VADPETEGRVAGDAEGGVSWIVIASQRVARMRAR
jgi:hypothetical protein